MRRNEFAVVLFETSDASAGWPKRALPAELMALPMLGDTTGQTAAKYGARWATVVLDADSRLVQARRDFADADITVEKLLPAK